MAVRIGRAREAQADARAIGFSVALPLVRLRSCAGGWRKRKRHPISPFAGRAIGSLADGAYSGALGADTRPAPTLPTHLGRRCFHGISRSSCAETASTVASSP
ncbi:hypothetical protein GCM10010869_74480 [Mesorhizobium tianshanense]|nr:hypothetical protein GCM10010869_74480 [Mesorhizobium tianshanense]